MLNLVASHLTGWPAIDPTQRLLKSFYGDDEAAYELPPGIYLLSAAYNMKPAMMDAKNNEAAST